MTVNIPIIKEAYDSGIHFNITDFTKINFMFVESLL